MGTVGFGALGGGVSMGAGGASIGGGGVSRGGDGAGTVPVQLPVHCSSVSKRLPLPWQPPYANSWHCSADGEKNLRMFPRGVFQIWVCLCACPTHPATCGSASTALLLPVHHCPICLTTSGWRRCRVLDRGTARSGGAAG